MLVRLLLLPALRLEFKLNTITYKNTAELSLGGIFNFRENYTDSIIIYVLIVLIMCGFILT